MLPSQIGLSIRDFRGLSQHIHGLRSRITLNTRHDVVYACSTISMSYSKSLCLTTSIV